VIIGRRWARPSEPFQQIKEIREARSAGGDRQVDELAQRYDVDVAEIDKVSIRQLFAEAGWPRAQLVRTSIGWLLYAAGFVAANTYTTDWLTQYRGFSMSTALALLLVASGIGIGFYALGALGERFGRQLVLVANALLTLGLTVGFYFAHITALIWALYILLCQVSNGTWSGTGPSRPACVRSVCDIRGAAATVRPRSLDSILIPSGRRHEPPASALQLRWVRGP
jgi:Major Facilitator Superfamily